MCDRNCNVIAPFVKAPGNSNETVLLKGGIEQLVSIAKSIGLKLAGSVMSLDGVYNCRGNRKTIFNFGMVPNIPENKRNRKRQSAEGNKSLIPKYLQKDLELSKEFLHGKTNLNVYYYDLNFLASIIMQ